MQQEVKKNSQYNDLWRKIDQMGKREQIPIENVIINNYGEYQVVTIYYLSLTKKKKEKYLLVDKENNIIYSQNFFEKRILPIDESHFIYTTHFDEKDYHEIVLVKDGKTTEKYGWIGVEPLEDSIHRSKEHPDHVIINHGEGNALYHLKKETFFDKNCFITYDKGEFCEMKETQTFRCVKNIKSDIPLNNDEQREKCTLQFFIDFEGNTVTDLYDLENVERYHTDCSVPIEFFFNVVKDSLNEKQVAKRNKKILRNSWVRNTKVR